MYSSLRKTCYPGIMVLAVLLAAAVFIMLQSELVFASQPDGDPPEPPVEDVTDSGYCGEGNYYQRVQWIIIGDTLRVSGDAAMEDFDAEAAPWSTYNAQIQSFIVEDGVTSIGNNACAGLYYLNEISIGADVGTISVNAFSMCPVKKISVSGGNQSFKFTGGALLSKDGSRLVVAAPAAKTFTVPASVKNIDQGAFTDIDYLKELVFAGDLPQDIGCPQFSGCDSLRIIRLKGKSRPVLMTAGSLFDVTAWSPFEAVDFYFPGDDQGYVKCSEPNMHPFLEGVAAAKLHPVYTTGASKITSVRAKKGRKALIRWKKVSKAGGYEIRYSTDKKFKKGVKKLTIKKGSVTKATLKKLKARKTYYVKIRAYRKVKNVVTGKSQTVWSSWSGAKKFKAKK